MLEDAQVYSGHAGKKELDVSDVRLAVQTRVDHSFTTPPPRDVCTLYIQYINIVHFLLSLYIDTSVSQLLRVAIVDSSKCL